MTSSIKINNLSKDYLIYDRPSDRLRQMFCKDKVFYKEFAALNDINLSVKRGEAVGIIGRNGSGKSTLLQLICGTLNATKGDLKVDGRISALLELGAGFNPDFSGKENIYLNASILGLSRKEIDEKYDDIVAFANIGDHLNQPVKTYSSGMYVRLAFAVAVATDPEILVVDEALAVGDIAFQRKCFARIKEMQKNGATILFVSHSINTIVDLCDRAILLDGGEVLMDCSPKQVTLNYQKLMFAPEEKRASIRLDILNGGVKSDECDDFDPDMKPESCVEYESVGAKISNPQLVTKSGKVVNILERGQEYIFNYEVEFEEEAESVRFGMGFRTKEGNVLGGCTTAVDDGDMENFKKGDKKKICFEFKSSLLNGAYFINAGCSALKNGERIHLHRILDAFMFSVKLEKESCAQGIVDFGIKSIIEDV